MQSPPSPLKNNKEALERFRLQREKYLRDELSNKLKKFCLSFLFGWEDSSLKTDIAIGVVRKECLLDALEEVIEYVKINYKEDTNERKD